MMVIVMIVTVAMAADTEKFQQWQVRIVTSDNQQSTEYQAGRLYGIEQRVCNRPR